MVSCNAKVSQPPCYNTSYKYCPVCPLHAFALGRPFPSLWHLSKNKFCMNSKSSWICVKRIKECIAYFVSIVEMTHSWITTLTIASWEETPKVGSLLPISQSPITDRSTPNSRICIRNTGISVRVVLNYFCNCLAGKKYTMSCQLILLGIVLKHFQAESYMILVKTLEKKHFLK